MNDNIKKYIVYALAIFGAVAILYSVYKKLSPKTYISPITGEKVTYEIFVVDTYKKQQEENKPKLNTVSPEDLKNKFNNPSTPI